MHSIKGVYLFVLVILFALGGFFTSFWVINDHLIEEPTVPAYITLQDKGNVSYRLPVIIKDTVGLSYAGKVMTDRPDIKAGQKIFHKNASFIVWVMLIMIMMTIAAGAFPVFALQSIYLIGEYKIKVLSWIFCVIMVLFILSVLCTIPLYQRGLYSPNDAVDKFGILLRNGGTVLRDIVLATSGLSLPTLFVMMLVVPASDNVKVADTSKESFLKAANKIERLNTILLSALQVLAVIVIFSVFTSSMLKESIKGAVQVNGFPIFPDEFSYIYGLNFSVFLGVVYLPVYMVLKLKSRVLLEKFEHEKAKLPDDDEKWHSTVTGKLSMTNSALDNLKMALTVAAPLITSFLPEYFKGF